MGDPYLLNRFFETPLATGRLPESQDIDASLARLLAQGPDAQLDRATPSVQRLADCALRLAARLTRDIGDQAGERYRWEWEASVERGASACRPGPFWSLLYWPHEGEPAELQLEDPRFPWVLIEEPNLRFRDRPGSPMWTHHHMVGLSPGKVVMFPAWLRYQLRAAESAIRIDLWALLGGEAAGQ